MVRNQSKERGGVIFFSKGNILQKGVFWNFGHEGVTGYYSFVIMIVVIIISSSKHWIRFIIFEIGSFFWKNIQDVCY